MGGKSALGSEGFKGPMQRLPTHSSQGFPNKLRLLLTPSQGGLLEHPAGTGQDRARSHRTPAAAAGCTVPVSPASWKDPPSLMPATREQDLLQAFQTFSFPSLALGANGASRTHWTK